MEKRHLRFRGWWPKINRFIYFNLHEEEIKFTTENDDGEMIFCSPRLNECAVQRFTGLNDINGKDIYEGDILKGGMFLSYLVKWDFMDCGWNISYNASEFEVIGNIIENPEILI